MAISTQVTRAFRPVPTSLADQYWFWSLIAPAMVSSDKTTLCQKMRKMTNLIQVSFIKGLFLFIAGSSFSSR